MYDSTATLVRTLVNNASQPQGVTQNVAWSAATSKGPAVAGTARLATASDTRNRAIVVSYHNAPDKANRVYRKGQDDSEGWLVQLASEAGTEVSLGVDRPPGL